MSVVEITWDQAKRMVSERLRRWIETMPIAERSLKIVWNQLLISPYEMLVHVERLDDLGKQIIAAELAKISEEVGITYVIKG